jgi:hypothetical protein
MCRPDVVGFQEVLIDRGFQLQAEFTGVQAAVTGVSGQHQREKRIGECLCNQPQLQACILYDQPGEDARLYPSDHWPILSDVAFV